MRQYIPRRFLWRDYANIFSAIAPHPTSLYLAPDAQVVDMGDVHTVLRPGYKYEP